jgi:predicted ATPase
MTERMKILIAYDGSQYAEAALHDFRGIDRLLLGSVSSTVSARAHCSVEVVRPKHTEGPQA